MKGSSLQESFLKEIQRRIPQKAKLTNALMDCLYIEKEAIYRRLRGDVPFTFSEVAIIAKNLGISVDKLIETNKENSKFFQLNCMEHANPEDKDYAQLESFVNLMASIKDDPETEACEASNTFCRPFLMTFPILSRFQTFKWNYQNASAENVHPFREMLIPERAQNLYDKYLLYHRDIKKNYFIWDNLIFQYLINDIKYFHSIYLITDEEAAELKDELLRLVDYIEELAITGKREKTGNKVYIYISDLNFDSSYCYLKSSTHKVSVVKAYQLNAMGSYDPEMFEKHLRWIESTKKSSVLISESGEIDRCKFINKQRERISQL